LTGTNARPSVAPTFGVEPMLGTNPLTFGIPTADEFPFVIDCATSTNQRGKLEQYAREGKLTPKGAVVDINGVERRDTEQILVDIGKGTCALTPVGGAGDELGGYKGYGWGTVVELLCVAAQSGPFGSALTGIDNVTKEKTPMPLGHFFLAIDVESLCDVETFKKNSSEVLDGLRKSKVSPRAEHGGRIFTAGEKEHIARVERTAAGGCPVPASLQKDMKVVRERFPELMKKYPIGSFPFE